MPIRKGAMNAFSVTELESWNFQYQIINLKKLRRFLRRRDGWENDFQKNFRSV